MSTEDSKNKDRKRRILEALNSDDPSNALIEAEYIGQEILNEKQRLPKDMQGNEQVLIDLGFVFLEEDGDLFIKAVFPKGWKMKPTDHSMWNTIFDDKGRERISVFYKAAFYDRHAHLHLVRRYNYSVRSTDETYRDLDAPRYVVVTDCGKVIWQSEPYGEKDFDCKRYELSDKLYQIGKDWLNEHFPDWESFTAYWE